MGTADVDTPSVMRRIATDMNEAVQTFTAKFKAKFPYHRVNPVTIEKVQMDFLMLNNAAPSPNDDVILALCAFFNDHADSPDPELGLWQEILPFFQCMLGLNDLANFAQADPRSMSAIWGSIADILQHAAGSTQILSNVVRAFRDLAGLLPNFLYWEESGPSPGMNFSAALGLFVGDILEHFNIMYDSLYYPAMRNELPHLWPLTARRLNSQRGVLLEHAHILGQASDLSIEVLDGAKAQLSVYCNKPNYGDAIRVDEEIVMRSIVRQLGVHLYDHKVEEVLESVPTLHVWAIHYDALRLWIQGFERSGRFFFITANRGVGKTTFASQIIRALLNQDDVVLHVFLDPTTPSTNTPLKVFQSLLFQLLDRCKPMLPLAQQYYVNHYSDLTTDGESVMRILAPALKGIPKVFIFVDGINQVDQSFSAALLHLVIDLTVECENVRLLATGTPDKPHSKLHTTPMDRILDGVIIQTEVKSLEMKDHQRTAIEGYLKKQRPRLSSHLAMLAATGSSNDLSLSDTETMIAWIVDESHNTFLYAKLWFETIMWIETGDGLSELIRAMSYNEHWQKLDFVYRVIIDYSESRDPAEGRVAGEIFQWLHVAPESSPLDVQDVLYAIAVKPGDRKFIDRPQRYYDVRRICGPVVEVTGDRRMRFFHRTVVDSLVQLKKDMNTATCHQVVASRLMSYLTLDNLQVLLPRYGLQQHIITRTQEQDFVLLEFAVRRWLYHVLGSLEDQERPVPQEFLDKLSKFLSMWENSSFVGASIAPRLRHPSLMGYPSICRALDYAALFEEQQRSASWDNDRARWCVLHSVDQADWVNMDPLCTSVAIRSFRWALERVLTPVNPPQPITFVSDLDEKYRGCTHCCDKPACDYHDHRFKLRDDRHVVVKRRGLKCPEQACPFQSMGFHTPSALNRHLATIHPYTYSQMDKRWTRDPEEVSSPEEADSEDGSETTEVMTVVQE